MIDSLQSAIHRRENHGYPSFWGKPQVREAIARFYRRQYDVELDPHSEVAVFQGSHIGIGGIPRALLSPGNTSSPPIPCIRFTARRRCSPRRRFMACRSGRRTISCRIFNDLPEVADKAGLVVLNYPHNPTGACYAGAVRQRAAVCSSSPVPILHDFAYAAIGSAASDAPLSFSQPDAKAWGVKPILFQDLNMAGWRFASRSATPRLSGRLKAAHP